MATNILIIGTKFLSDESYKNDEKIMIISRNK